MFRATYYHTWVLLFLLLGCNERNTTRPSEKDRTPPAKVEDLRVSSPEGRQVSLNWTASGDDGTEGQASRYEIRYLALPLTEQNWDSADVVASPPVPKASGLAEHLLLADLPDGTWYFALKVADEIPNWSVLSNVATATVSDVIPPGTVNDLLVSTTSAHSATLSWTAPGDDGNQGVAAQYDIRYSLAPITDESWNAALRAQGLPAPNPAGSLEALRVPALETGQTYYFALKAADEKPNWSMLSNLASSVIADVLPPARVIDLAIPSASVESVTLSWTAPGNDGVDGTATRYDLRYASTAITEETWNLATPVQGIAPPDTAGTRESFVVNGLEIGRIYYFALKTADEVSNWSVLSNVVSAVPDSSSLRRLTTDPNSGPGAGAYAPAWSPDGGRIAFRADWAITYQGDIYTISAAGGEATRLTTNPGLDSKYASWSPDGGSIAYSAGPPRGAGKSDLWIMNATDGSDPVRLASAEGSIGVSAWSPDGSKIAYGAYTSFPSGSTAHIYVIPSSGGDPVDLTPSPSFNAGPAWSPDGARIAFMSDRGGSEEVWVMSADGGSPVQLTHGGPAYSDGPTWSPDGNRIAFYSDRTGNGEIWVMSASGQDLTQLTFDPSFDAQPAWSPDGGRIAFSSSRTGKAEIWVLQLGASPLR